MVPSCTIITTAAFHRNHQPLGDRIRCEPNEQCGIVLRATENVGSPMVEIMPENSQLGFTTLTSHVAISQAYKVTNVSSKSLTKRLRLSNGTTLSVHRFACVGQGDEILVTAKGIVCVKTYNGYISITPPYSEVVAFEPVEGRHLILECREIVSLPDYDAYEALSQFHYRNQNSFGRRAILVLKCRNPDFPSALGFVEITTAFLSSKNRSALFDAPFESDVGRHVKWERWNKRTRREYTNSVARISRMVVHPEVRGIGLSKVLIREAEKFCNQRWQVQGLRPLFLEITADMLKFMPFVYSSQMHWIGDSPGNRERIERDMRYLESKREGRRDHWINRPSSRGIASRQRKDIDKVLDLKESFEQDGKDIFLQLSKVAEGNEDVDAHTYELLSSLVRTPKPTFMKGLTRRADAFVKSRCVSLGLKYTNQEQTQQVASCSSPIRVRSLNLAFSVDTGFPGATNIGVVRRAFGLPRNFTFGTGIKDLNLEVNPREICLVYGSSGSGKTALLSLIAGDNQLGVNKIVSGSVQLPTDGIIGVLQDEWPNTPLLSSIGARNLNEAIDSLNASGLAEPRLYLSKWNHLSAGQKYRAQLARLMCSKANIWLLDEFASNLDDATAMSVGRNFARAARQREVICVVASVRRVPLINSLTPDLVVSLNQVERPKVSRDWRSIAGVSNGN